MKPTADVSWYIRYRWIRCSWFIRPKEQNDFGKGRSCIDPTFMIRLIIEERTEFNLETHLQFIDTMKPFNDIAKRLLYGVQLKKLDSY